MKYLIIITLFMFLVGCGDTIVNKYYEDPAYDSCDVIFSYEQNGLVGMSDFAVIEHNTITVSIIFKYETDTVRVPFDTLKIKYQRGDDLIFKKYYPSEFGFYEIK